MMFYKTLYQPYNVQDPSLAYNIYI